MSKRIISFLLAVSMVMSLFAFSLSVTAATPSFTPRYTGAAVEFRFTDVVPPGGNVDVVLNNQFDGDAPTPLGVGVGADGVLQSQIVVWPYATTNGYVDAPSLYNTMTVDGVSFGIITRWDVEFDLNLPPGVAAAYAPPAISDGRTPNAALPSTVAAPAVPVILGTDPDYEFIGWLPAPVAALPADATAADIAALGLLTGASLPVGATPAGQPDGATVNEITGETTLYATWQATTSAVYTVRVIPLDATPAGSLNATVQRGDSAVFEAFLYSDGVRVPSADQPPASAWEWNFDPAVAGITPANATGVNPFTPVAQGNAPEGAHPLTATVEAPDGTWPVGGATLTVVGPTPTPTPTPRPTPDPGRFGRGDHRGATMRDGLGLYTPEEEEVAPPEEVRDPRWDIDRTPAFLLFHDVPRDSWFHDFVTIVAHYRMFQGTGHREFSPHTPMDRAMFAQVLANRAGVELAPFAAQAPAFNDISGHWGLAAINWAATTGVTFGVSATEFAPTTPISREQMAAMLHRYAEHRVISLPAGATTQFTDQANVSDWAVTPVAAINAAGIIRGYPDGTFLPQQTATRAEVSTVFARFVMITTDCPVCFSMIGNR